MSDLITVKAKTQTGNIQDFRVLEIISIDGKPFEETEGTLRDTVCHLSGRVDALFQMIGEQGNG